MWEMETEVARALETLIAFALDKKLIEPFDEQYARNALLDILGEEAPSATPVSPGALPETATHVLKTLIDDAAARGKVDVALTAQRELLESRLMGVFTARPSVIAAQFASIRDEQGIESATRWFYGLCRDVNYIRVDDIARNEYFRADSPVGSLEITINLSKPEKTTEEIAALKNLPSSGYPKCMLCVENVGYAGRLNFPGRFNHRMIPLELQGDPWYFQYSPYQYYEEHCIVLGGRHVDMHLTRDSFQRLFDFVDQFPHYFIGSNADLPIVGGSILNHDHFQGGRHTFPMTEARVATKVWFPKFPAVKAGIVEWPMTALRLQGSSRPHLIEAAMAIMNVWRGYSDPEYDIYAFTGEADGVRIEHNTITPILRLDDACDYILDLVLRNNRQTPEHPMGLFHPHAKLHHIKQENIGLIEVMGLFILPGRLKSELAMVRECLTGERILLQAPPPGDPLAKHYEWILELQETRVPGQTADECIRQGLAKKCAQVLVDAGVYKRDENGESGLLAFLRTLGAMVVE